MKKIVILGAGKIGRGFVADAFAAGGYKLVFADADAALVKRCGSGGIIRCATSVRRTNRRQR